MDGRSARRTWKNNFSFSITDVLLFLAAFGDAGATNRPAGGGGEGIRRFHFTASSAAATQHL